MIPAEQLTALSRQLDPFAVPDVGPDVSLEVQACHHDLLHPELRQVPVVRPDRLLWPALELVKDGDGWRGEAIAASESILLALRWVLGEELLKHSGLLLHASSVLLDGAGHAFLGTSGAGKTTIAQELEWDGVFSDELTILAPDSAGSWMVWPSPFWGTPLAHQPIDPAPLSGLWILAQGERTEITLLGQSEAAVQVYQRAFEIQAVERAPDLALEVISRLIAAVPPQTLSWRRGDSLRSNLRKAAGSPDR
ncbi:MAG: hypothetical protein JW797_15650 [Bradymonadales bacterium]|nr:hypothetical protein [Bradymonadales bacterium]